MDILQSIFNDINAPSRHKRFIALLIAVIIYLLIAAALFLETVLVRDKNRHTNTSASQHTAATPNSSNRKAAPVMYMPQPKKPAAPAQTSQPVVAPQMPVQPPQLPTTEKTTEQEKPLTTAKKTAPKIEERKVIETPKPPVEQLHKDEPAPIATPAEAIAEAVEDAEALARRRSKEKWFKNGVIPNYQPLPMPQAPRASHKREGEANAYSHGMPQYAGNATASHLTKNLYDNHGAGAFFKNAAPPKDEAQAFEYAMFLSKFNQIFCRQSRMNPMRVHANLIQPHTISLELICTKNRKIRAVRFIQQSYDPQVNDYIEEIIRSIVPPQLPSTFPEEEALMLLRIKMDRVYQQNVICFIPAGDF